MGSGPDPTGATGCLPGSPVTGNNATISAQRRPVVPASRRPADCGQAARCTEPLRYQLHTSSVANGRKGASRRTKVSTAIASVARAERTAAAS